MNVLLATFHCLSNVKKCIYLQCAVDTNNRVVIYKPTIHSNSVVSGMIREDTKEDHSTFSWTGGQGMWKIKLRAKLAKSEFKSSRIKTKL